MQSLEEFYASVGSNAGEIIGRLGGNEGMVRKFLSKFPADNSINELKAALDAGDTDTAFRCAHTMKGLCATLGIQSVFEKASNVTELLRAKNIDDAKTAFPALREEYEKALESLKSLG